MLSLVRCLVRFPLYTGACQPEVPGMRRGHAQEDQALLPASKSGPRTIVQASPTRSTEKPRSMVERACLTDAIAPATQSREREYASHDPKAPGCGSRRDIAADTAKHAAILPVLLYFPVDLQQTQSRDGASVAHTDVMTAREVAERLKVKNHTICRLAAAKEISRFKVGGSWRFRKGAVDRWAEANAIQLEATAVWAGRKP